MAGSFRFQTSGTYWLDTITLYDSSSVLPFLDGHRLADFQMSLLARKTTRIRERHVDAECCGGILCQSIPAVKLRLMKDSKSQIRTQIGHLLNIKRTGRMLT